MFIPWSERYWLNSCNLLCYKYNMVYMHYLSIYLGRTRRYYETSPQLCVASEKACPGLKHMAVNSEQNKPWTLTLTRAVSNLFQAGSDFPSSKAEGRNNWNMEGLEGRLYNIDEILSIVTENVEIPP